MNNNVISVPHPRADLVDRSWTINSDTAGIRLHLKNRRRADIDVFGNARTVMLMHAATYASNSLYDVTHGETPSFMSFLAANGYDVYSIDVRGYGRSTQPSQMHEPPEANAPIVNTATAISDLGAAVNNVVERNGLSRLNLIGMSWGGTVVGAYAARVPERVNKLCLIAPQWIDDGELSIDTGGNLGAYRVVSRQQARERWLGAIPVDQRPAFAPADLLKRWEEMTFGDDTKPYRVPNGVLQDRRDYWAAGRAFYEPGDIKSPTLLIHGEWDRDVPLAATQAYFLSLTGAPYKRWIEIGQATHMLILERHRQRVFDDIDAFLTKN